VERDDEIGALARSLNAMADRLAAYEREMIEKNRLAALGTMAARIAHEVRNPLTALKLQLQLLAESARGEQRDTIAVLEDEVGRLELIVAGVLGQAQAGPLRLERRPVALDALIGEVLRLFRPQLAHRGIELEARASALPAPLSLDPDRLKQVLVNLLVNARDALPDGGLVRVSWDALAGGGALVSIEDSGPGLPPEECERVLAGGVSSKPDGLGLGMRLSRELVEAHGGDLALRASPLGGLRVELRLPQAGDAR
jgi:signal transduction histidine kinase